jgi:hypothetical protein
MQEDWTTAAKLAGVAAAVGAGARVALALHSGVRRLGMLTVEALVGGSLGIMAAGAVAYWHPEGLEAGRSLLIVAGASGASGAIGLRLLDLLTAAAQRKIG